MGRPKVPKSQALRPGVSIRLNLEELRKVKEAATVSNQTTSEFSRKSLLSAADVILSSR